MSVHQTTKMEDHTLENFDDVAVCSIVPEHVLEGIINAGFAHPRHSIRSDEQSRTRKTVVIFEKPSSTRFAADGPRVEDALTF